MICFKVSISVSVIGPNGDPVVRLFNAFRMSRVALDMISDADAVGIGVCVGNQVSVSAILSRLVSVIHVLKHRYDCIAGPTYHPSTACGAHVFRFSGFSWTSTFIPGGAIGVRLKSNCPWTWAHAERFGLIRDPRIRLSVRTAC